MKLNEVEKIYKALADKTRIRILTLLKEGKLCVCDLENALQMSQPRISQHLLKLKNAALIEDEQKGKWKYFYLSSIGKKFLNNKTKDILKILNKDKQIKQDLKKLEKFKKEKNKLIC